MCPERHGDGVEMSAPDPVAALRKYVASIEGDIPTLDQCGVIEVAAAPWAVLRAAPALLAYVERLEADLKAVRVFGDIYCSAWHTIEDAFIEVDQDELDRKHTPEQARDFIRSVLAERDRLREVIVWVVGDMVRHAPEQRMGMTAFWMEELREALGERQP